MKPTTTKGLLWAPRVLGVAMAAFLGLFALDVFDMGLGFWGTLRALMMHLVPSFIVLAAVVTAWKPSRSWSGALLFALLGLGYIGLAWGRFPFTTYLAISGPLFVIAGLYGWGWRRPGRD